MQPTVTIIINNYNYAHFLPEAIDSALNQTYGQVEVLVVDDGSTDNSVQVIEGYSQRVTPIVKPNGGQASAMNLGFQSSQGDIVLFLDADDYLFPEAVATIVDTWRSDLALLQCRLEMVDQNGKYIDLYPAPELLFDSGSDVWQLLLKKGCFRTTVTSGLAFSRQVLSKIMPIPEADFKISADGYLVTLAPFYGAVASLEKPWGARRKHTNNHWSDSSVGQQGKISRRSIEHDFTKYRFLNLTAQSLGHTIEPQLELSDYRHIMHRLSSLRLEPAQHPVKNDSVWILITRGWQAVWFQSRLPAKRKLVLSVWFVCVGLLPASLAKKVVSWLLAPQSRPQLVDAIAKRIRWATQS
ncbi:MAG: glycosyltransferase [Cyanobacteria bacterium P01_B01_bin.77]